MSETLRVPQAPKTPTQLPIPQKKPYAVGNDLKGPLRHLSNWGQHLAAEIYNPNVATAKVDMAPILESKYAITVTRPDKHSTHKIMRIGVDFGDVLFKHESYAGEDAKSLLIPGAMEALIALKELGHELHLISSCSRRRAIERKSIIDKIFPPNLFTDLWFTKSDKAKADICKHIGCHVHIDDNSDIVNNIKIVAPDVKCYLFNNGKDEWFNISQSILKLPIKEHVRPQNMSSKELSKSLYVV